MIKTELENLLNSLGVPVNEGTPEDTQIEASARICFWDYVWEPLTASGQEYNTKVTYQVSFIADMPRCKELISIKHELDKLNIHPIIQHEYDVETRRWHSFFSIEVLENI